MRPHLVLFLAKMGKVRPHLLHFHAKTWKVRPHLVHFNAKMSLNWTICNHFVKTMEQKDKINH